MIAVVRIRHRNYTHFTLYRSCLLIYGIAINRSLSFLILDGFEENANISVVIKSGSTAGYGYVVSGNLLWCPSSLLKFFSGGSRLGILDIHLGLVSQ